jgi:hypothetical protein
VRASDDTCSYNAPEKTQRASPNNPNFLVPEHSKHPNYKQAIAESADAIEWLQGAASKAKRKYAETVSQKTALPAKTPPAPVVEAEERRAKIRKITEAAAQKSKGDLAEKNAKAEVKKLELVKQAAVEDLRGEL